MSWTPGQEKLLAKTPPVKDWCPGKNCRKPCGPGICQCLPCLLPCCTKRLERAMRRRGHGRLSPTSRSTSPGYQPRLFVPTTTRGAA